LFKIVLIIVGIDGILKAAN